MFIFKKQFPVSLRAGKTVSKNFKNFKIFLASRLSPDPPPVFEINQTCLPTSRFAQILPNTQHFTYHWSMQTFYSSGIGPDILMEVLEYYIIFRLGRLGFYLIFILKKTKVFVLELYWKCFFHLLLWRNLVNSKNTRKNFREETIAKEIFAEQIFTKFIFAIYDFNCKNFFRKFFKTSQSQKFPPQNLLIFSQ